MDRKRPELKDWGLPELIEKAAAAYPHNTALKDRHESLDYRQLNEITDLIAGGLKQKGYRAGDIFGLFCNTALRSITAFYALQKLHARVIVFPEKIHSGQLENYFRIKEMKAVFMDREHFDLYSGHSIFKDTEIFLTTAGSCGDSDGFDRLSEYGRSASFTDRDTEKTDCLATAVMLFTSGTTGVPHLVMTSGRSRANSAIQQAFDLGMTENDSVMGVLPMHHCFGLTASITAAAAAGAELFIPEDRHSHTVLNDLRDYGCTIMNCVPSLYNAIITKPDFSEYRLKLRTGIIGGGRYTPEMFCRIEKSFGPGFTLLSSLGMTEGTAGVTVCSAEDPIDLRSTTVGRFMAYIDGCILNGKGEKCSGPGEICFKGYNVMQGYYGEDHSRVLTEDGLLHSGDIGFTDGNGYIRLTGRLKEIIIRAGENISPAEVENAIYRHPSVKQCKAVGVPDRHLGEALCAVIECDAPIAVPELEKICAERLPSSMIPETFVFTETMPLNENGKIDLKECRRMAEEFRNSRPCRPL